MVQILLCINALHDVPFRLRDRKLEQEMIMEKQFLLRSAVVILPLAYANIIFTLGNRSDAAHA
jgi:hypothetical protein